MKEHSSYITSDSNSIDVKFQNFFTCPEGNGNNYSLKDLDQMLLFKHYLNGLVFLFVTVM